MQKENIVAVAVGLTIIFGTVYYVNAPKKTASPKQKDVTNALNQKFTNMTSLEFQSKIKEFGASNKDYVLLDVRTQQEFDSGFISGAKNIDFYKGKGFVEALSKMDKDKPYFIYCRSGSRSGKTMQIMKDLGFKEVYNLSGGILDWNAKGLPLVKP